MELIKTLIDGLMVIKPKVYDDDRGYFFESFKKSFLLSNSFTMNFIQDNESKSEFGVLRGLHFQKPPFDQSKLVRVVKGSVLDVVVDLRKESKTFGKHFSIELSEHNKKQLLIPRGFAHGFVVTSKEAIFCYKVDNIYNSEAESGIKFNDSTLNINWILPEDALTVSEKDKNLKSFKEVINEL